MSFYPVSKPSRSTVDGSRRFAGRLRAAAIICVLGWLAAPNASFGQGLGLDKIIDAIKAQNPSSQEQSFFDQYNNNGIPPTEGEEDEEAKRQRKVVEPAGPLRSEESVPLNAPYSDVSVNKEPGGAISIMAREAPVSEVLELLAQTQGFNLVLATSAANNQISITLRKVPVDRALDAVVQIAGMTWSRRDDIIMVTSLEGSEGISPQVQNREIRVFELDYAAVDSVQAGVEQLLSPVGRITTHQTTDQNIRETKNLVVVEDLPEFMVRIEDYITQVDQPPRQVLIEARVLEVKLTDNYAHGVNLLYQLAAGQGSTLNLSTRGFANPNATQALLFTLTSDNINNAVELIETTLDSKTLASPRILAVNGQEAQIQVGGQLGFRVLTTTQTSTLEQVQFLNTGVILRITPYITRDNRVLMHVHPEVSTGEINDQGLPEAQTTTVDTQVILPDGQGMVIGGLIRETYADRQAKVPVIGDIKWVGRLFQRRGVDRDRTEVIIALIPRIVPYGDCQTSERDREELARTDAPIFRGALGRNPRPWDPQLFDACENPRTKRDLCPWDRRMNPRDNNTYVPYPTDPASRACLDEEGTGNCAGSAFDGATIGIDGVMVPEEMPLEFEVPDSEPPPRAVPVQPPPPAPNPPFEVPATDPPSSSTEPVPPAEADPSLGARAVPIPVVMPRSQGIQAAGYTEERTTNGRPWKPVGAWKSRRGATSKPAAAVPAESLTPAE